LLLNLQLTPFLFLFFVTWLAILVDALQQRL
jgi:hypothetical protein